MADSIKEMGFAGLGRMGGNMAARLLKNSKIKVTVWNRSPEPVKEAVKKGAAASKDMKDLVGRLKGKRKAVWLMLPAGNVTEQYFQELLRLLNKGDILIDGGNSNIHDTLRRHKEAEKRGILMLDIGVSGGIVAATRGYAMMAGGSKEAYYFVEPAISAMCMKEGYSYMGEGGAGHYVKMVHNAIEYGMMQAIAEGFDLLKNGRFKNLDLGKIAHLWNHGTIVTSFLMEMSESALKNNGNELSKLEPWVDDSGEGQWAAQEALEFQVPFVANAYALHTRRISRKKADYAYKMLAAIRNEFGAHAVKTKK
ncbi:decarboxylating 6-phosphogluconate dehydrogenase [Candidatus Woesearchaeota archaeon]|nr:decarboxylating 6-phosphogluconate dehydrogenase [Candidatus Woesearchaeota archaeon]